jgi:hypothetical protein
LAKRRTSGESGNEAERRDRTAQQAPELQRPAWIAGVGVIETRKTGTWRKTAIATENGHDLKNPTANAQPSAQSTLHIAFAPGGNCNVYQTHRSTPPNALAHDHDRQQVSWLAGYRLGPPSQDQPIPVVFMVVGYPPTVAGAAAELPAKADAPHSLG